MKKSLKKISKSLSPIFVVIIIVLSFLSFSSISITQKDYNALKDQIQFNKDNKQSALVVDGVRPDGTKMTEEEIAERKEIESKMVDVDVISPEITKVIRNADIDVMILGTAIVLLGGLLILLQNGIFKTISSFTLSTIVGAALSIVFTFNLKRYIPMGNIEKICASQIATIISLFGVFVVAKIIASRLESRALAKERKETEERIAKKLQQRKEIENEILETKNSQKGPIFVIATREDSTTTSVHSKTLEEDDSELIVTNQKLSKLAYQDGLTKLYNRTKFLEDIEKINKEKTNIIVFDVNDLKKTNDTYGHLEGDKLITTVAENIKAVFQNTSKCYRIGGDEFTVVTKNCENDEIINEKITELRDKLDLINDLHLPIKVAIGNTTFNSNVDNNLNDTFDRADSLMYQNKEEMKKMSSVNVKEDNNDDEEDIILTNTITSDNSNQLLEEERKKHQEEIERLKQEQYQKEQERLRNEEINRQRKIEEENERARQAELEKQKREEENRLLEEKKAEERRQIQEQERIKKEEQERLLQEEKQRIAEEKQRLEEEKNRIAEEKKKQEEIKRNYDKSEKPVYERYVQKLDGSVEKVEDDGTVMANYESIRNYLDRKEKKTNNNPYFIDDNPTKETTKSSSLPFADYDPEKESPFSAANMKKEEVKNIVHTEKNINLEESLDIEEDDC